VARNTRTTPTVKDKILIRNSSASKVARLILTRPYSPEARLPYPIGQQGAKPELRKVCRFGAMQLRCSGECCLHTAEVAGSIPASPALTQRQSCVTCDLDYASGILVSLLTGRLQRHVSGQGGDPVQPNAHRRVGSEVEAALGGDGRVNVEGDVGYGGAISDEELAVA
jgi:hypothetical protein